MSARVLQLTANYLDMIICIIT